MVDSRSEREVYVFWRFMGTLGTSPIEYRGYGRSQGSPSETGLYRDSDAAYEYLVQTKRIAPRTIISFGQSLGSPVAAHLAANTEVGGVILEAPFPSLRATARRVFWFLPGIELSVLTQFRTSRYIARINAPVLVVHCTGSCHPA